jgi:hypothetical protein
VNPDGFEAPPPRPDDSRAAIRRQAIREAVLALPLRPDAAVDYAVNVIDMTLPDPDSRGEWLRRFPADAARQAVEELRTLLLAAERFRTASAALGRTAIDALNQAKKERDLRWPSPNSDWSFAQQGQVDQIWPGLLPTIAAAIDALAAMPPQPGRDARGNLEQAIGLLASLYAMLTGKRPAGSNDPTPFSQFVVAVMTAAGIEDVKGFRYAGE